MLHFEQDVLARPSMQVGLPRVRVSKVSPSLRPLAVATQRAVRNALPVIVAVVLYTGILTLLLATFIWKYMVA